MDDLLSQLAREVAENALADHANRRKPGEPTPTSVRNGRVVLTLMTIFALAPCLGFAWLIFNPTALENDERAIALVLIGAFALASTLSLWGAVTHRIDWDGDSVRFREFWSDRTLPWSEIAGVAKKSLFPRIRIAFRDGGAFAIYETMHNSRYFMHLIQSRLTPGSPGRSKRGERRQRAKKGRK
jgi:hypothetical protein